MFQDRSLPTDLEAVRTAHAPDALVLDCERDFETMDPAVAEDLALLVDGLDPLSYPQEWVPPEAPEVLSRLASGTFTIGAPEDGGVTWTRQTTPPTVFVKPRTEGSPEDFIDFLIAESLVEAGTDLPEHFLGFFEAQFRELTTATPLSPAGDYQLAAALYTAYRGLHTQDVFAGWQGEHDRLYDTWHDAGDRLEPRLEDLSEEVARGQTEFATAAELACSAVKHALELPAPFAALDTETYRQHGASYAVKWAEKTFEKLDT